MIQHHRLAVVILLILPFQFLSAQNFNTDIRKAAENDLFRGDLLAEDLKTVRNQTWEEVSLSLLVQDVEAEAKAAGLESFSLNISNNSINIIYRDIRFLPNSAELTPETREKISSLTRILNRFSRMSLLVKGHTAKLSPEDTDDGLLLSEQRAQSVAGSIAASGFFSAEQIESVGKGFYEPVADNSTSEGRALNRRVEISIVGSMNQNADESMVWWNFLSESMHPGYTAYLVHHNKLEEVKTAADSSGIAGLTFAETPAGIGILDDSISFQGDGAPDSASLERMQNLAKVLSLVDSEAEARIGGYGSELPAEKIEEQLFLTAYTLGVIAGLKSDNIIYGSAPYTLHKATAELASCSISTPDGTPVVINSTGESYFAVVPFSVNSIAIDFTPADTAALISGLPEGYFELVPGINEISVKAESSAGSRKISKKYSLSVQRQKAEPLALSLAANDMPLSISPDFSADIKLYSAHIPVETANVEVSLSLLPEDRAAGAVTDIVKEYEEELAFGKNTIMLVLSDGYSEDDIYTIEVYRQAPAATSLAQVSAVSDQGGSIELIPEFSPDIFSYRAFVPYLVESVSIDLVPADTYTVLEADHAEYQLSVGKNELATIVTDQLGSSFTEYKLLIERAAPAVTTLDNVSVLSSDGSNIELIPAFSPNVTSYRAVVPYSAESVTIDLVPTDNDALLQTDHAEVPISVGDNEFATLITDQSGNSAAEYKLVIERSAPALSRLEITGKGQEGKIFMVPDFNPEVTRYNVLVPYSVNSVELAAALGENDRKAGASMEVLPDNGKELPVGTCEKIVRIQYADGKSLDYLVEVTREEKQEITFDIFGISLLPEWYVTPSLSFYTGGAGFKLNGGMTVRVSEESDVDDRLLPLRVGLGAHVHTGAGNYLTILSGGLYLSGEYIFSTESFLPSDWYFPRSIIPRVETGFAYYGIDYTEGIYHEGPAFYLSPAVRTDFVLPLLKEMTFGLDISYTAYISSLPITYLSLGVNVGR